MILPRGDMGSIPQALEWPPKVYEGSYNCAVDILTLIVLNVFGHIAY